MTGSLMRVLAVLAIGVMSANAQQLTTTQDVNLRSGPSKNARIITALTAGTEVTLLRTRSGYDRVQTADSTIGWIYGRFLADATATTAPVGTTTTTTTTPTTTAHAPGPVAAGSYHSCDVKGKVSPNAHNAQALEQLNQLKNRATEPADGELDPNFTLANLLKPGADDNRFNVASGGVIEGIVVDAKVGGVETVNCKATDPLYRDTHIEVAQQASATPTQRVIVEVTPRWRDAMSKAGADWTTQGLKALCGHRVRFRGWAMYDVEHRQQAKNTAPNNAADWRATVWELHPVTSFEVLDPQAAGAACLTP